MQIALQVEPTGYVLPETVFTKKQIFLQIMEESKNCPFGLSTGNEILIYEPWICELT